VQPRVLLQGYRVKGKG